MRSSTVSQSALSKQVCRHLHNLVATSLNLQYHVELAAEGLIDGQPGGPASMTAARKDLLERRVAWRATRSMASDA